MSDRDTDSALDLSVRARRSLLSDTEQAAFREKLSRDATLRMIHQVGLDLDRSTAVRVGDEALIARVADAAIERVQASGLSAELQASPAGRTRTLPTRRRRVALLVAAAIVCATGIAAGMWADVVPTPWFGSKRDGSERAPPNAVHRENAAPRMSSTAASAPAGEEPKPLPAAPPSEVTDVGRERTPPRGAPEATAQALFKSANAARRDGDFPLAERLYSELIGRYPSSDEAGLARVTLGRLLLANGNPSDAEREFGRYLKGGTGQLTEEALVSRAESLQKMGRAKAERDTWQRLLAEFPASVYAAKAKGRQDALKREAVTPAP